MRLAVAAGRSGQPRYHLTLVDLAGGPPRILTDEQPTDGASLVVIADERMLLVDPASGALRELTRFLGRA